MNWFSKRSKEASTYAGGAAILAGLGTIFKVKETEAVVGAVEQAGSVIVGGGSYIEGGIMLALGLLAAFKSDGDKSWW